MSGGSSTGSGPAPDQVASTRDAALEAAGFGLLVFPLWWPRDGGCACRRGRDCRNPGKHPRITNWQELATTDEAAIRDWWRRWPMANVGILTGTRSGLVVLDYDPAEEAVESLAVVEALYGALPDTVQVLSGRVDELSGRRGLHYYFRHPGVDISNSVRSLAPHLDVRGEGGLVVGAGSVHVTGRHYEWEIAHHPVDLPLAEFPVPIVEALRRPRTVHHEAAHWVEPAGLPPIAERIRRAKAWLVQRPAATQGEGGASFTMGTCAVVVRGFALGDEESALEALADWNARCAPPWDEGPDAPAADSLRRKIRQAMQSSIVAVGEKLAALPRARAGSGRQPRSSAEEDAPDAPDTECEDGEGASVPAQDDRPAIVVEGDLEQQARAVLEAIAEHNDPPFIFQQARRLVRVVSIGDGPLVEDLDRESFRAHLGERFRVFEPHENKKTGETKFVLADMTLALTSYILGRARWTLPSLKTIVRAPCLAPDGTMVLEDGYHPGIEGLLALDGFRVPEVPVVPSADDVACAKALILDDLFFDFPFVDDASRSHAVALGLLPFVRPLIAGPSPIHMVSGPSEGVGKSKLVGLLSSVATGRHPTILTVPRDDGEMEKKLTATLRLSPAVVLLDNVSSLDSPSLASATTAEMYCGRDLGHARNIEVPVRCSWTATGNNPRLTREMSRRTIWIRIDPRVEAPWRRTGFKHNPIEGWVHENRALLARAFLILAQHWIASGRPGGAQTLGSYEVWARTLGGILDCAGIPGFLSNLESCHEQADTSSREWAAFVSAWWQRYGDRRIAVAGLLTLADEGDLLVELRGEKNAASQKIRLGRALQQRADRIIAGFRITLGVDRSTEVNRYALVDTRTAESAESAVSDAGQDTVITI